MNSYQRPAFLAVAVVDATPVEPTRMLCAVQTRPLRIVAANKRSSRASRLPLVPPVLPVCSTGLEYEVVGTVTPRSVDIVGVALPGLLTRRKSILLKAALSTPTK